MNHQAHCSSEDHIPNCICFSPISFHRLWRNRMKGGCVYAVHVNETIDRILLMSGIYRILKKMDSLDAIKKEMVKGGYYE